MTEALDAVRAAATVAACAAACLFAAAGTIGLFRFPDAYTRLQASSLAGTAAVVSVFAAALFAAPDVEVAFRLVVIIVIFLVSSPTATHIIARYAWKSGLDPWSRPREKKRR